MTPTDSEYRKNDKTVSYTSDTKMSNIPFFPFVSELSNSNETFVELASIETSTLPPSVQKIFAELKDWQIKFSAFHHQAEKMCDLLNQFDPRQNRVVRVDAACFARLVEQYQTAIRAKSIAKKQLKYLATILMIHNELIVSTQLPIDIVDIVIKYL